MSHLSLLVKGAISGRRPYATPECLHLELIAERMRQKEMFGISQINEMTFLHSIFAIPLATCDTLVRLEEPLIAVLGRYTTLSNIPVSRYGYARVGEL